MRSSRAPIVLALLIFAGTSAYAQRVSEPAIKPVPRESSAAVQPRRNSRGLKKVELLRIGAAGVGSTAGGGLTGVGAGWLAGLADCLIREKDDAHTLLICPFERHAPIYGAYAGTFIGAALGAGGAAIGAGCTAHAAWRRSFLGSFAGSLPALGYLAAGRSNRRAVQNAVLIGTPILQAAGSIAAVSGCKVSS